MSEATNFKNNATGQQIDLVDEEARNQIEELNETLTQQNIFILSNAITTGEDLDSYTTPGKYYCNSAAIAASLNNTPFTTAGFGMLVMLTASSARFIQIVFGNTATDAIKYRTLTGDGWRNWVTLG